ncbi:hypothetical protein LAB1_22660 [Roseibium sp. LAB1]
MSAVTGFSPMMAISAECISKRAITLPFRRLSDVCGTDLILLDPPFLFPTANRSRFWAHVLATDRSKKHKLS